MICNPFRLIYVSCVDQYKHQWHLVEAVARLRQEGLPLVLNLVGPAYPPALSRLKATIHKFPSANDWVCYYGELPYEVLHRQYEQADIGIASKDGSRLFVSNSKLSSIKKAGLMAYVKKPIYGPAEISAEKLEFHSTKSNAIAQEGSKIFIDGKIIPPIALNIEKLYPARGKR